MEEPYQSCERNGLLDGIFQLSLGYVLLWLINGVWRNVKFYYFDFYFNSVLFKGSSTISQHVHRQSLGESGQNIIHVEAEGSYSSRKKTGLGAPSLLRGSGLTSIGDGVGSPEWVTSSLNSVMVSEAHTVRKWQNSEAKFLIPQGRIVDLLNFKSFSLYWNTFFWKNRFLELSGFTDFKIVFCYL